MFIFNKIQEFPRKFRKKMSDEKYEYISQNVYGIIYIPYSVHQTKILDLYSIGIPIFVPSLEMLSTFASINTYFDRPLNISLNMKCPNRWPQPKGIMLHKQSGNKASVFGNNMGSLTELSMFTIKSKCCSTDPFSLIYEKEWLKFSDFYVNNYMDGLIYFNNINDLFRKMKQIIINNKNNFNNINKIKSKQINHFKKLSNDFKPYWIEYLINAHKKSNNNCLIDVNNMSKCILSNKD